MNRCHPNAYVYFLLSANLIIGGLRLGAAEPPSVFSGAEGKIDFGTAYTVRTTPGKTEYADFLPRALQTIDFCPWQPQPPEVQQVMRPERGYLCELHIFPRLSDAVMQAAIEKVQGGDKGLRRHTSAGQMTIGQHRVMHWRRELGKSRLDHYLLHGTKFSYLFVSSPYGSRGSMEKIITKMAWGAPSAEKP